MKPTTMRVTLPAAFTALLLTGGQAWAEGTVTVSTATEAPYGTYLVDAEGMSLYLFEADEPGGKSTCDGACAEAWPPLLTKGDPQAGAEANSELLGTIERQGGAAQVTYNGWPLYYFVKDSKPGDTEGQDIEGFGAEWYLVDPQGQTVHAEEEEAEGDGGSGGYY